MRNYISRNIIPILGGLALALGVPAVQAQTSTNLLSLTTFDPSAASPWGYGYFYGDSGLGVQQYNKEYYLPEDVDQTNGLFQYTFDLSAITATTGYGTGTGGPLFRTDTDPASFVSTNREDYVFTFDARVEGFAGAATNVNAEMQVQLYYNDENATAVKYLQVNLPFSVGTNWQTYSFALDAGSLADNTADSDLALHHAETSDIRFNVNFGEPHNAFGNDADNAFYLDNVKLEVISKPTVVPPVLTGKPLVEWNFDDKLAWYKYDYEYSQNDSHVVQTSDNNANGNTPNTLGKNGGSAWFLNVDNSSLAANPPGYAGAGTGGGGPADFTLFDTGDLASYRVSFDARVIGLAEGKTNTGAILQLFLDAPDDTVTPVDEDTNADPLARFDFPITRVGTDWQTYTFLLSKGGIGSGSKANFTNYYNKISDLRTQWQIENAASEADWGYDAENTLVIDNFKVERLYAGLGATITATRNGNNLVLTWDASSGAQLQAATNVAGPYTTIDAATSGYSVPMTGQQQFFKLVQPPATP